MSEVRDEPECGGRSSAEQSKHFKCGEHRRRRCGRAQQARHRYRDICLALRSELDGGRKAVEKRVDRGYENPAQAKINPAYADGEADVKGGGPALLTKTVEQLTGLHIDHFISVSFGQFVNISNAIGGVQVCVENPALSGVDDEGVTVPTQYEHGAYDTKYDGLALPPGVQTISGATALKFVRQRHDLPGGDIDRIHRQQRFIAAVVAKAEMTTNPTAGGSRGEILEGGGRHRARHPSRTASSALLSTEPARNRQRATVAPAAIEISAPS